MDALTVNNLRVGVRQHFPTAMIQAVVQLSLSDYRIHTNPDWLINTLENLKKSDVTQLVL